MGHCSRAYYERPDFRTPARGTPNDGWTFNDPYRTAHYASYRNTPPPPSGRGPNRRPPYVPIIVVMIVLTSSAPAGMVLLPLIVFGLVMVSAASQGARRRRWEQPISRRESVARPAMTPAPPAATPAPASTAATAVESAVEDSWPSRNPAVRSPFEQPAFWDRDPATAQQLSPAPLRPPAWDPLGVAPFAWDLPDPPPLKPVRQPRRLHIGGAKLITASVLMAALLATAGDFAGWWPLDWAAAATSVLAVVAIAMIGGSLRQRAGR